ncbi:MAG: radical SAM additional 4Fe4S-binding SPASM domain-containing protein [Candidatus Electronema aureum]|uniref:Radical SAM additional 4Fe4S-binding SPASM domain-containing protein n=1 Tax=Candidatus Electronema aureum TaxID=2005002 RepID=A0A521G579_9BACT|nr:MAG: radical SAM additional 4Fe4S-binding SPASM domain-containing protein [Candidatus Electronema aureum]
MIHEGKYEKFKSNDLESLVKIDPFEIMEGIFGGKYLEYRRNWKDTHEEYRDSKFPLHIDVDLEDACNQNCAMCHQKYRSRNGATMTWVLLKKIIDEGVQNGLCAINFGSSAEPLLQKELLMKGINYCNENQIMDIFLHTNGLLLDSEFALLLIDSGLRHICISIDAATVERYKKSRRSNDYDKIVENILNFIKNRERRSKSFPTVRVSFCVNPTNYTEKAMFKEFWADKVDIVEFQGFRHINETPATGGEFEKVKIKCSSPFRRVMIWPEGDMSLCCGYKSPDVTLGNVLNSSIISLWNSDKMNKIRESFKGNEKMPETCLKCLDSNYHIKNKA